MSDELRGPLKGHRVLELGSTAAGPYCARLLADFGAEVVKIEMTEGDPIRALGDEVGGKSLYAATLFRNKRIVGLNLREPRGRALLASLIPHFDVIVENFRPGTLEKWGLGYEELKKLRPDIILTRVSGFGQTGPYSGRPGYGVIGEAMSGLRHMIGDADRPPSRAALPLTDYIAGVFAAFGTSMAMHEREKSGLGQCVDASLMESAFSFMEAFVPSYEKTGRIGMRSGARLPNSAPNTLFPTREGSHIHITALANSIFGRLVDAMGRPELKTDPRFADQHARNANEAKLEALIGEWTVEQTLEELEALLNAAEVPASRVYTMADIFADPHYRAREMLVSVPDEDLGSVTLAGVIPKLSRTAGGICWSGRRTGQDTRDVLKQFASLGDAELDELQAAGVILCDHTEKIHS
jgi:crotonobetainyl-CoA:carnitine CoA-transferase CaiB-like acyl-CoA transferase